MTGPATTDPRVHQAEASDGADEVWTTNTNWSYERYGDGWCAMSGRMRRPSPGNPFASLVDATAYTLGPAEAAR